MDTNNYTTTIRSLYEAQSIVALVKRDLSAISDDNDPLKLAEDSSTWTRALEGVSHILLDTIGKLEVAESEEFSAQIRARNTAQEEQS